MLDCRGLACPQPVITTKQEVEAQAPEKIKVLVDNKAASQNVSRFLETQGYATQISLREGDYMVSGEREAGRPVETAPPPEAFTCATGEPGGGRQLVLVRSDTLGRGDDALGAGLMKNFLLTLKEMGPALWRILFLNNGVKLCVTGSESLEPLRELEKNGVSILVCGTCLTFFGLLDEKQVGETTNMLDVVTSLQLADKVISV